MKKSIFVWTAVFIFATAFSTASANIWWQRGDAGSTWQDWTFDDDDNPAAPENYYNPYDGVPSAAIDVSGTIHLDPPGWYDEYLGRPGVWHGDFASVTLLIDNAEVQNPYKEVWVEVGFRGYLLPNELYPNYPGEIYGPQLTAWIAGVETPDVVQIGDPIIEPTGAGWQKLTIGWRIYPNPDKEEIYLSFHNSGADIDYVYVDTICIPEPTTLALLSLGGFLLRKKRK